ncbi:MAG: FliI/YscN family ATPase [candidate division Zixibacteria bacterium]|nr:FliI/YscN family ATPase [candidate division Zixibacteria bacterium]
MKFQYDTYQSYRPLIEDTPEYFLSGRVTRSIGLIYQATGLKASVGQICEISTGNRGERVIAEVIGFNGDKIILMALDDSVGIMPGAEIKLTTSPLMARISPSIIGRVIDGLGNPIDGKGPIRGNDYVTLNNKAPHPLKRRRIREPFFTGIRSLDSLLTIGKGQRIGIFAGSGLGKSVLMGMIARNCYGDVNVIALIGERGREVREFIEKDLGEEGLSRSVVVVVTSNESPLLKIKGSFLATAIAEYFRDRGDNVMLMMDSLTRVATSQREIGLAAGEPPTTRGYTPSSFTLIPKLLERAGASQAGSITGIYTVLVEGDDHDEPVSDSARATLDGHIVLSRKLAARNLYPAIDVNSSISRVMPDIINEEHLSVANECKRLMAVYNDAEDLINIGAYAKGSSKDIDEAIAKIGPIRTFLQQKIMEKSVPEEAIGELKNIVNKKFEPAEDKQ